MGVRTTLIGTTLTLAIDGDLDVESSAAPVQHLRTYVGRHHLEQVVVDVSGVGFVDSSGLGALIRVQQEARRYGARTRLAGVEPRLQRLLQLTGLDREFLAHRPRPEARDEAS